MTLIFNFFFHLTHIFNLLPILCSVIASTNSFSSVAIHLTGLESVGSADEHQPYQDTRQILGSNIYYPKIHKGHLNPRNTFMVQEYHVVVLPDQSCKCIVHGTHY